MEHYTQFTGVTTVAASNSIEECKAKANFVCDGVDDQEELYQSIIRAPIIQTKVDTSPSSQAVVDCYGRHAVVWYPGDYYLNGTLVVPNSADCNIEAEGTYFHYLPKEGDAVEVNGAMRCRYHFGTIESGSVGAALKLVPSSLRRTSMGMQMSEVSFTGLIGHDQKGVGMFLAKGNCTNSYKGTDIYGFDTGVFVETAAGSKVDTNWFWFSYIRMCNTCIIEQGVRVDDNVWHVNVDASLPNSTGIRIGATFGKWYVIMGVHDNPANQALVFEPGASHNVVEVHPAIDNFVWVDNSGNTTNVVLSSRRPPYI